MEKLDILIDFDGTVVAHDFPRIGDDIGAVPVLKKLVANGHRLILFTMRADRNDTNEPLTPGINNKKGPFLTDAINWFKENGIELYGIQTNPTQKNWTTSPKAYGHLMIDDSALGCPLKWDIAVSKRPFVDWNYVELVLKHKGLI